MKTALLVGTLIGVLATSSWAGSNLNLSKSNINRIMLRGTVVTASTDISGAVSQIVYRTPASGDFILTQACTGLVPGGTLLQVGGVSLAQLGSGQCQTFTPGTVLPPDEVVTCTTFAPEATTFCTISGLLGPQVPTPLPTLTPHP